MTKIVCRASDCVFWDAGICGSEDIVYDPENGCLTHEGLEDVLPEEDEDWEEEEGAKTLDEDPLEWEEDDELIDAEDKDDNWRM